MPFPYRFGQPDERTDSDRLEELRSLQRQVQSILTSRDDRAFAEAFVTRVRERRAGLANRTQFARIPDKHGSFSLAAVTQRQEAEPSEPGELLIHADDFDRVRHVLELYELVDSAGLTRPEYVAELKDKVVRLRGGRLNQVERANLASNLRRQGVRISVNYMTPMGGPVKSVGTPEPTAGPVPACPLAETEETESSPVRVLIIDTGVYGLRSDVWLTDLDTEANREDLDYFPPDSYLDLAAGHGSFCAGIVQQIVPEAQIVVSKQLDSDGFAHELRVARELVRRVRHGLEARQHVIVNLSVGTQTADDERPIAGGAALEIIEEKARAAGL